MSDEQEAAGPKRVHMTMRLAPQLRTRIERAASENGRSLTQEAELRLEKSFDQEEYVRTTLRYMLGGPFAQKIVLGFSNLLNMIETVERKKLLDDIPTTMLAYVAMIDMIEMIYDRPKIPADLRRIMSERVRPIIDNAEQNMTSPDFTKVLKNIALADFWSSVVRGEKLKAENYDDLMLLLEAEAKDRLAQKGEA